MKKQLLQVISTAFNLRKIFRNAALHLAFHTNNFLIRKTLLSMCVALGTLTVNAQTVWQVSTVAGNGTYGNTNGPAASASFSAPQGICSDISGNIYVASPGGNESIRKITPGGVVSTFASGFSGPSGICADAAGNLYLADYYNNLVRKITPSGVVSTFCSSITSPFGICIDPSGNLYVTDYHNSQIRKVTPAGVVSTFASGFNKVYYLCADAAGNIYLADMGANSIIKITPAGVKSTFASVPKPIGVTVDASGNLYVTSSDAKIRKITSAGVVSIIAGDILGNRDDIGTKARFGYPFGIFIDAGNHIYVADQDNRNVRKIEPVVVTPPVPNYNLPASMCLGATANYQPATTGSQAGITLQMDSSITIPGPKAICRNKNGVFILSAADSVLFYDFAGNKQPVTYNTMPLFQNVTAIAADAANRLYMVAPDMNNPAIPSIYRLDAQGNWDTQFTLASGALNSASAIAFGPGYLYVVDTLGPYIDLIDTTSSGSPATVTALPQPGNLQYSWYKPTSLVFGSNGQMYLADAGNKAILARNASDNNYYAVDSLPGTHHYFAIDMDSTVNNNVNNSSFFITSDVSPSLAWSEITSIPSNDSTIVVHHKDTVPFMHLNNPMGSVYANQGGTVPISWIANNGGNNVMRVSIFAYSISPPLPAGLNYNFITGKITGSPTAIAPFTTYTIVTQSTAGTNTSTIAFSVVPPGPISNTVGATSSAVVNQADGLTVNYFNTSDCSQMISIQDAPGGTVLGNTIATQTVYPTIATFNADTFVGRVTEVATQSPDSALANVQLNFTYEDIQHYNASVAATYTLSNDTAVTKQMQVGILQMHTKKTGSKQPISHSPLTANWVSAHHQWEIKFAVTKFSTFFMGDAAKISAFNCATGSTDSINTINNYYIWHYDTLWSTGVYADTLMNQTGCDSVCTLKLTINQTTGITPILEKGVSVYPNPSNGMLNIAVSDPNVEIKNIRVLNLMGEEVYVSNDNSRKRMIDLSSLPKGFYSVTITSGQETLVKKILIE